MNKFLKLLPVMLTAAVLTGAERPAEVVAADRAVEIKRVISRRYTAKLTGIYDVALVPRVSGVILEQKFKHGDSVKAGQLLFVIEDTTYRAKRDAAKANLVKAKAELDYADRNKKRIATLWKQKATSESSYEEAVRLYDFAAAVVAFAEAELMDAENNLNYTRIYSPIDGRVDKSAVSAKNYITPTTGKLLTVVSLDPIYIDFTMSSRDYLTMFGSFEAVQEHSRVQVKLADDTVYPQLAKIIYMSNRVDKDTDTIGFRAIIPNPDRKLIPDALVTVLLSRQYDEPAVAVPVTAVMNNGKTDYVFVLDNAGMVAVRPVKLGGLQDNMQIIASGLKAGETIITDGGHKVRPGNIVKAVLPAKPGSGQGR